MTIFKRSSLAILLALSTAGCVERVEVAALSEAAPEVILEREVVALPEVVAADEELAGAPISLLLSPIAQLHNRKVASLGRSIAVAAPRARVQGVPGRGGDSGPAIGVFDPLTTGLPSHIWDNSQGVETLRAFLDVPSRIGSHEILDLMHITLGAQVPPPRGRATFERFLRERITKIYELGFPATVVAIARSIPASEQPQWLQELALRSMIATGLDGDACRTANRIKKTPSTSAWLIRLRLACVLLSQGPDEARSQLTRMTTTGQIDDGDFAELMRIALARNKDQRVTNRLQVHRDFEPELLLLDHVQITDDSDWFRQVVPAQLHRLMRSAGLKTEQRIKVAEYAATRGIISGRDLAKVYRDAVQDANIASSSLLAVGRTGAAASDNRGFAGGVGLPSASGRVEVSPSQFSQPPMQRADYLWRAERASDSRARIAYIRRYLHESAKEGLTNAAVEAALPALRKIPVIGDNVDGGDIAVFLALKAGAKDLADEWLSLIRRDPVAAQVIASRSLPLSYLELLGTAGGIIELPAANLAADETAAAQGQQAEQPTDGDAEDRAATPRAPVYTDTSLRAQLRRREIPREPNLGLPRESVVREILFALGRDMRALRLRESLEQARANSAGDAEQSTPSSGDPMSRRLEQIREAARQERVGDVVAYASALAPYLAQRPRIAAVVIESLRRIGLERRARAIAIEVLTARNRIL